MNKTIASHNRNLPDSTEYSHLWEEIDGLADLSDETIREHVRMHISNVFDGDTEFEGTFEEWLADSDYEYAVKQTISARDNAQAMQELESVMTVAEVADEFEQSEDTVRKACQRYAQSISGGLRSRQSGSTYLMLRRDAKARWGKK